MLVPHDVQKELFSDSLSTSSCGKQCLSHTGQNCNILYPKQIRSNTTVKKYCQTRSTQRAQTSLAEADHYSHIVHCKNVEPWLWKTAHPLKKKKKGSGSLPSPWSGYATTIMVFFAHLLILQYPDHHQNLISSYLYYSGPVHKISSQSVNNFLSNVVHRQTNKHTNRQTDRQTN